MKQGFDLAGIFIENFDLANGRSKVIFHERVVYGIFKRVTGFPVTLFYVLHFLDADNRKIFVNSLLNIELLRSINSFIFISGCISYVCGLILLFNLFCATSAVSASRTDDLLRFLYVSDIIKFINIQPRFGNFSLRRCEDFLIEETMPVLESKDVNGYKETTKLLKEKTHVRKNNH